MASGGVPRPEDRGGMDGGYAQGGERGVRNLAAVLGDLEVPAEERLGGGRPQQDQDLRVHHADLRVEPGPACADVAEVGLAVDPALPPSLPVEVLHHIREVDVLAWDAGFRERPLKQRSGRSDEAAAPSISRGPAVVTA